MKTIFLIFSVLVITNELTAQTTAIPDAIFEDYLVIEGLDSYPLNGSVPTANIDTVTAITGLEGVSDFTGLEDFTSLIHLSIPFNNHTSIDLSQNTLLTYLRMSECYQITTLDLSQNTALEYIDVNSSLALADINTSQCSALNFLDLRSISDISIDLTPNILLAYLFIGGVNMMGNIDLTQNTDLIYLWYSYSHVSSIDLSQNTALTEFYCINNDSLTCLNVKNTNNTQMPDFTSTNNPLLTCITVDDDVWSTASWTNIDATSSFSVGCSNLCSTSQSLSIDEGTSLNNQTSVYPNPTNGQLAIDFTIYPANITATLYNSLGQLIYFQNFEDSKKVSFEIVEPKGLYFLQIESDTGKNEIIKIIKE